MKGKAHVEHENENVKNASAGHDLCADIGIFQGEVDVDRSKGDLEMYLYSDTLSNG